MSYHKPYFFTDDSLFFLKANHDECRALVDILNSYCLASGQGINFSKSEALFSPNTPIRLQQSLSSTLGVRIMDNHARYLGLPSVFGRNKKDMFMFIFDKVLTKM